MKEYVAYLDAILLGDNLERARYSFKILAKDGLDYITIQDIRRMLHEVSLLWNYLTQA